MIARPDTVKSVRDERAVFGYWNAGIIAVGGGVYPPDQNIFQTMIISRTPYRISFFGGGTDYPAWYRRHGGAVLAATINKYCYLTCRYLPPFFEHRTRVVYSKMEVVQSLDELVHPSARETLRFLKMDRGVEIHHDGDLPGRSGMGSSSAFTVGLLHALYALKGQIVGKRQLARESIHLEQDILQETVGSQDQVCAAYGGVNRINFFPNGDFSVQPMTVSQERLAELNSHLMLFYTGIKRTASQVAASYVTKMEKRAALLDKMRECVDKSCDILSGKTGSGRVRRTAARNLAGQTRVEQQGFQRGGGFAVCRGARERRAGRKTSGRGRRRIRPVVCPAQTPGPDQKAFQAVDSGAIQIRVQRQPDHFLRSGGGFRQA